MIAALGIIARFGIAALVGFEGLNWAGVLGFTLDFSWLGLIVTAVAVFVLLEGSSFFLRRTTDHGLHPLVYLAGVASLSVDALGDIAHWYGRFGWYDQLAHFQGGVVAAAISYNILWQLERAGRIRLGAAGRTVTVVAFTAFLGVLYEMEEYFEDLWYWGRQVRLGDGPDTVNDIIFNIVGALAVLVVVAAWLRWRGTARPMGPIRPISPIP